MFKMMQFGVALVAVAALASACSGSVDISFGGESPDETAVDLIEGDEMAGLLGLGPITNAVCEPAPNSDVGTTFPCVADTNDGLLEFDVEIDREDHIFATATNIVGPDTAARLAVAAVQALNDSQNFGLPEDSIDCGDNATLITDPLLLECALTSPDTTDVYDTIIEVTDLSDGSFTVDVADTPRP